ncbi:MAG: hypothetical protein R6X32_16710 [Chloroflexota bacterium]
MLQRWLKRLNDRLAAAITAEDKAQIAWLRLQKMAAYLLLRQWRLALLELTRAGVQHEAAAYTNIAAAHVQKAQYLIQAEQWPEAMAALQQALNLYTVLEDPAGRSQAWQAVVTQMVAGGHIRRAFDLLVEGVGDLAGWPAQQTALYQWQARLHVLQLDMDQAQRAMNKAVEAAKADQSALSDRIESYRQVLRPLFDGSQPVEALVTLVVGLGQSLHITIPDAPDLLAANDAWENGRFHEALQLAQAIRLQAMNDNEQDFTKYGRYLAASLICAQTYERLGERTAALVTFNEAKQWLSPQLGQATYINTILTHWAARWGQDAFRSAQRQAQRWEKSP